MDAIKQPELPMNERVKILHEASLDAWKIGCILIDPFFKDADLAHFEVASEIRKYLNDPSWERINVLCKKFLKY